jgi:hypothetical protein
VAAMLQQLEDGLQHGLDDLQGELAELLPKIEKYLNP